MIVKVVLITVALAGGPPQLSIADVPDVDTCIKMVQDILKHPPSDFGAKILSVACHTEEGDPT